MTTLDTTSQVASPARDIRVDSPPQVRVIRTGPRGLGHPTSDFAGLLSTVREAGLLRRRRSFYILMFLGVSIAMAAAWVGFAYLRGSWWELLIAAAIGVLLTQYAFLGHEASHRQVWESARVNDHTARWLCDLVVGISYSWWMNKHSRHHAQPNTIDRDPDIEKDFLVFQEKQARELTGISALLAPRQGWIFFPALTLEGMNLHVQAFKTVLGRGRVDKRALEIVLLAIRNLGYWAVVFSFLPIGMAFAFLGVQMAVFGVYMGISFAPNHKGMPHIPANARVDFLRRQVITSRNIYGRGTTTLMGGLNYQIEHHLFPSMARPNLKRTSEIVRDYCESFDVPYTSVRLFESYAIVVAYFNRVGLAARDPFDCPAATQFGR
ncbi:MAG TPA: acyl-CoA desaturase [Galbitalea sp.]|nr:acyl-CoA desaturase [Galbitalea sp.]